MVRHLLFRPKALRCWLLASVHLLFIPLPARCEILTVVLDFQLLYSRPDFSSSQVGRVPLGANVEKIQQRGDWIEVMYGGTKGWIHSVAVRPAGSGATRAPIIPIIVRPEPVKERKDDEVALAGKGFTPEVEAAYRQQHPEMQYQLVDMVESFVVDHEALGVFIQEGGLRP